MSKCFIVALPEEINNADQIYGIPIYYSGIGKLNSAIATYELINKGFTEIINIGSCGSQNHKVGELLKVGKVYQDIDVTPIYEFGLTTKNVEDQSIIIDPTSNISCFSTDYFFDHNQKSKYSNNYLESIQKYNIFDMECFSQARICFEKKHD